MAKGLGRVPAEGLRGVRLQMVPGRGRVRQVRCGVGSGRAGWCVQGGEGRGGEGRGREGKGREGRKKVPVYSVLVERSCGIVAVVVVEAGEGTTSMLVPSLLDS